MAKRLTDKEKEEILNSFMNGQTIENLSKSYKCTNPTIIRNLKKRLGDKKYHEILNQNKNLDKSLLKKINSSKTAKTNLFIDDKLEKIQSKDKNFSEVINKEKISSDTFLEIPPLDYAIDDSLQKDLSSIHLSEVKFPQVVYMIVDKKIELEVKFLKDYPNWQFLSDDELNRKTIEIYLDSKIAKSFCSKEQKVIKVPNTNVFSIVSDILKSRGITRIVSADQLIAL